MAKLNLPFSVDLPRHAGSRPRIHPGECAAYSIAGRIPKVAFSPRTADETAKVIDALRQEGASISVRGAGTKQWRPPAPRSIDAVIDMSRCRGILEHTPADLTVTVAAGTPFADLQSALRTHGQFFPCDPVFAADATIGGVLASRSSGALRQRYGALRDNVLGMRVCLSDGSTAFTGAKVVKSVAGYDIAKLFVGAFGTLGVIAEATLKISPVPAQEGLIIAGFARADAACDAALQIAVSPLFPLAATLHDARSLRRVRALGATDGAGWSLLVRCGGMHAAVRRQMDGVRAICGAGDAVSMTSLDADRVPHAWGDVSELAGGALYPAADFLCLKIGALPTQTPAVIQELAIGFDQPEITLHPTVGLTYAHIPAAETTRGLEPLESFLQKCAASDWNVEYLSAPPALQDVLLQPVSLRAPLRLMRRIKAAFDPTGTFDAGRFLAAI